MTARSTSRTPALGTVADAPRAGAARVGSAIGTVFAISVALAMAIFGSSQAFAAGPASAVAAASSPAGEAANRFIVKPGQSLNDVAIAVTQSHDRAVLSRASKAIFDANPSSFMRGDPNLMKLGAVLTIPPLDSTGAVVAQAPAPVAASSAASGATATAAAAASAPHEPLSAPSVGSASAAGAPGVRLEGSAVSGTPASANVASAPGLPASSGAPRAVAQAPTGAVPASAPVTAAGGGHAWTGTIQQAPTPSVASGAPSAGASDAVSPASAPASLASTGMATTASGGAPASAVRPHTFSSLQQLLAFKNRVLMDLQRHGFGSKAAHEASGPAVGVSGASVVMLSPVHKQAGPSTVTAPRGPQPSERFIGIGGYGISVAGASVPAIAAVASAIVAALLVLTVALVTSGRKRRVARATTAPAVSLAPQRGAAVDEALERASAHAEGPHDPVEAEYLSTLARTPTSKRALMGLAGHYAERGNARGLDEIAQRIRHLSGGRGPNWLHIAALGRQLDPDNPLYAISEEPADDTFDESVGGEGVLPPHSAQAQRGEEEPDVEVKLSGMEHAQAPVEPTGTATAEAERAAHAAAEEAAEPHEEDETAPSALAAEPHAAPSSAETAGPHEATHAGVREPRFPAEAIAALNDLELGLPPRVEATPGHDARESVLHGDGAVDAGLGSAIEREFPVEPEDMHSSQSLHESQDARADIPPHDLDAWHEPESAGYVEAKHEPDVTREAEPTPEPESTHERESMYEAESAHATDPAHEPESAHEVDAKHEADSKHESESEYEPEHQPEHEHEPTPEPESTHNPEPTHAPAAPAAVSPAVAGLGAARFGPLKLAFDLNLPADDSTGAAASTPPQPAFTTEEIAKIARNKLELAAEYIDLGDLGGARTLIHEVIESNDPATRDEAQALLATLAPLS